MTRISDRAFHLRTPRLRNSWMTATFLTWIGAVGLIGFMSAAAAEKAAEAAELRAAAIETAAPVPTVQDRSTIQAAV